MTLPKDWELRPGTYGGDLPNEQILWRLDIKSGLFRRKVKESWLITNMGIKKGSFYVPLQFISDIIVSNRRSITEGQSYHPPYQSFQNAGWTYHDLETRTVGDVVFFYDAGKTVVFAGLENPDYLVGLVRNLKNSITYPTNTPEVEGEKKNPCPKCGVENDAGANYCNECGLPLI
ncbi:MAG: hypothetical protein DA330_10725 [Nitrososphaera sp.]|nr:hypothetical protein [Nitrososphaera sp.]